LAQTYAQTLRTSALLDAVSGKLGYPVSGGQVNVTIVQNTQLIDIAIEDSNPERTAEIANTLVNVFAQRNADMQAQQFTASEDSLKAQIAQVEAQIASLQSQSSTVADAKLQENIDKTKSEMDALQKQIVEMNAEINQLKTVTKIGFATPTPDPVNVSKINEKELELQQIQGTYDLYKQIYTNLVVLGDSSVKNDTTAQQMQSTLAIYQQIRANLLNSYENIRLTRLSRTSNIVSIEPARVPVSPIRPQPLTNAALGAVVGLMLAAGIVFLFEYLDDTIKSAEQVGQMLGLPVIGYIAEIEHGPESAYVSENPRSPVAEAFRTLRTNLEFAAVDAPLKTVLVVSVHPGEGKSTVACNLAITLAQGGKRVLLIDSDLRRPHVHRILGLTNRAGLSDLFRETLSLADVTRPWLDSGLGVVTSGGIPPNPADLLASKKMEAILASASESFDIVVVDAPPFLVADASILASRVDGILLVIRPGKTPMDAALSTMEQMKRSGGRVIGVVMNRIPRNRPYYYGGYRHYTAYYRGEYSYYDESNRKDGGSSGGKPAKGWAVRNPFASRAKHASDPGDGSKA
jgi:capsular exopolysaccharide synthesis family protein